MPLYEYECSACKHRFELLQKFSDPPAKVCIRCGEPVHKLLSSPAIQFKGTGWYVTDYARSGAASEEKRAKADSDGDKAVASPQPSAAKDSARTSDPKSAKSDSP